MLEEERNSHLTKEQLLRSALSEAGRHLEEVNQQKEAVEARVRGLEQQLEEERNSHLTTERQLSSALSLGEESLAEFRRQQSCDWIIQREEVVISEQNLSPHVRESGFRNPGIFCLWNPESWALESGIQH